MAFVEAHAYLRREATNYKTCVIGERNLAQGVQCLVALDAALCCALDLCDDSQKSILKRWSERTRRIAARIVLTRGWCELAVKLKSLAALLRQEAVEGRHNGAGCPFSVPSGNGSCWKRILCQLARLGRALPLPSESVVEKSWKEHRQVLTTDFKTPRADLDGFEDFCSKLFRKPFQGSYAAPSLSSCMEKSVREGGTAARVKELSDAFRLKMISYSELIELTIAAPYGLLGRYQLNRLSNIDFLQRTGESQGYLCQADSVMFLWDRSYECSFEDWECIRERLFSIVACWFSLQESSDSLPLCRQVVVKERGFKARMVTPLEGALVYLGTVVNHFLLGVLKSYGPTACSLKGRPAEHLDWDTAGRITNVVRSADLKAASDYLPHDLIGAGVKGVIKGSGMTTDIAWLVRRCVGSFNMECVDGSSVTTSRGALMGCPVTWPLLSAYMCYLHEASKSDGWYSVVGDDYLGCHTWRTNAMFSAALVRTGGVSSPGKDLCSGNGLGVLAEELISVQRKRLYRTASVRSVCGFAKGEMPSWAMGPSLSSSVEGVLSARCIAHLVKRFFGHSINLLRHVVRMDPFAPRWLGGAGFPGVPSDRSLRWARGLRGQKAETLVKLASSAAGLWSSSKVDRRLRKVALASVSKLLGEFGVSTKDEENSMTTAEFLQQWTSSRSYAYQLCFASDKAGTVLDLFTLRSRFALVKTSFDHVSRWVPLEKVRDRFGLLSVLGKMEPRWRQITLVAPDVAVDVRWMRGELVEPGGPREGRLGLGL